MFAQARLIEMKVLFILGIIAGFGCLAMPATAWAEPKLPVGNIWYENAMAELKKKESQLQPNRQRAKNIILMISDGNGIATNYATRLYIGQQAGGYGEEYVLPQETLPYLALAKTYNTNAQTPDSAGSATAMLSGVKTRSGVIGADARVARGNCADLPKGRVASIGEIMTAKGKAVGVISTARITHATPAAVYAHTADRDFEDDSAMPETCALPDIAAQLVTAMKNGMVDVALGGGRRHFIPRRMFDVINHTARRKDDRNLLDEMKNAGFAVLFDKQDFEKADFSASPIIGLFNSTHMSFEHDRQTRKKDEPSLAAMTEKTIKRLQKNDKGYFLLIEGGRVDHANHGGNLHRAVTDGKAFADAVAKVMQMTNPTDTLLIVTADHGHTLTFNGYCGRGSPITGLCYEIDPTGEKHKETANRARDDKPYSVAAYMNGMTSILDEDDGFHGTRARLTAGKARRPNMRQEALVPTAYETHSGLDVAIYASGPFAYLLNGTVEQNYIFNVMMRAVE
jgi:alkaline phosphatase